MSPPAPATLALTGLALIAFAANSILTRLALGHGAIDAASFTAIRLVAGALVLGLVVRMQAGSWAALGGPSWLGAAALLAYAAPFSFAYLRIGAAVGALVLFGVVQLTMIGYGVLRGARPTQRAWLGLALASSGLLFLTLPSARRPDLGGVGLMVVAGVAWAVYSLLGARTRDPLAANARSFVWSSVPALVLCLALHRTVHASLAGVAWAVCSGALTSGLGYTIWYHALRRLEVTAAAVAQLSVPVIAALGATALLGERVSLRLAFTGAAVLLGVALVLTANTRLVTRPR
ncbi:MAG: DMT family transporter [Polyangiaceae bacterium]